MQIILLRTEILPDRTLGTLYLPNGWWCHTLEPQLRGSTDGAQLHKSDACIGSSPSQLCCVGDPIKGCIPFGTYELRNTWSPRFKRWLPQVMNVPGYSGIRIHAGNTPAHTSGCILVGQRLGNDLTRSRDTLSALLQQLRSNELHTITIE